MHNRKRKALNQQSSMKSGKSAKSAKNMSRHSIAPIQEIPEISVEEEGSKLTQLIMIFHSSPSVS